MSELANEEPEEWQGDKSPYDEDDAWDTQDEEVTD